MQMLPSPAALECLLKAPCALQDEQGAVCPEGHRKPLWEDEMR